MLFVKREFEIHDQSQRRAKALSSCKTRTRVLHTYQHVYTRLHNCEKPHVGKTVGGSVLGSGVHMHVHMHRDYQGIAVRVGSHRGVNVERRGKSQPTLAAVSGRYGGQSTGCTGFKCGTSKSLSVGESVESDSVRKRGGTDSVAGQRPRT